MATWISPDVTLARINTLQDAVYNLESSGAYGEALLWLDEIIRTVDIQRAGSTYIDQRSYRGALHRIRDARIQACNDIESLVTRREPDACMIGDDHTIFSRHPVLYLYVAGEFKKGDNPLSNFTF